MKLHTYYVDCPKHAGRGERELLALWEKNWQAIGVETCVLSRSAAESHPFFKEFDAAVSQFPSVNSKEYEVACFHRWLALATVGGGYMSDYDVFNRGNLNLSEILNSWSLVDLAHLHIFQEPQVCPSLVHATPDVIIAICQQMMTGDFGLRKIKKRDHYSDMYALYDMFYHSDKDLIRLHNIVRDYPAEGWEKYDVVHFNSAGMTRNGNMPKFLHVERLLK